MRHFDPAYVGLGSKREFPHIGLMSASTSYGHTLREAMREKCQKPTGRSRSPPPSPVSLLLDALDPNDAEAGVLTANVRHVPPLFVFKCLERVHITEL